MPRNNKRRERNGGGSAAARRNTDVSLPPPSDEECDGLDTMSVVSNCSDFQTAVLSTDGSEDLEVDEMTAQDDFEDKIKSCMEGLLQKSAKGRVECLRSLRAALAKQYMYDFISERKMTLGDSIERCLKKGKGEEQSSAAICAVLLLIQLGSGSDGEEVVHSLYPILKAIMLDNSASYIARAACAEALGLCTFIAEEEIEKIMEAMAALEDVFRVLYCKGDGSVPNHTPDAASLHTNALNAWTLLLSTLPSSVLPMVLSRQRMSDILLNADVDIRISAGEAMALLHELVRADDEDYEPDNFDDLCAELKRLATECNKYRAKKDRRQQRSSFRDILNSVENGEFSKQRIRVNVQEVIIVSSWTTRVQYNAFCHVLGSGMNIHLQENELLRDVFSLGPPILSTGPVVTKASKTERHMAHDAAFKARTKSRAKLRDKKSVGAALD